MRAMHSCNSWLYIVPRIKRYNAVHAESKPNTFFHKQMSITVELQWLEHGWRVNHGCFELVLESLGKNPIAADIIIFGIIKCDFLFLYYQWHVVCTH